MPDSKQDEEFAEAQALKRRLRREAGANRSFTLRGAIIESVLKRHPAVDPDELAEHLEFLGF